MAARMQNIPISAAFLGTAGLKEDIKSGLVATGFDSISSMQQRAIYAVMDGFDVIVFSTFGSNENAILSLCALQQIDTALKEVQILVLAPTHETAREIRIYVNGVGRFMKINCQ
ncbi:eukaryotic initiation factor 4A-III-like protein, partial [Leptotrombidium deliense]